MPIVLLLSFIFYSLLSWILLLRDEWTLEVLSTKFYPQHEAFIYWARDLFLPFKLNTSATILFLVFIIVAFFAYFLAIKKRYSPGKIILISIIFQVIVFFSYPILSTDVLNYILSDRVATVYHQNVWTTKPNIFSNDPYYFLVYPVYPKGDWNNYTRIYGPVNQAVYSAVTAVSGDDFLVNIAAHKLVVLVFNIATLVLVYYLLKKHFPDKLSSGLIFVFWNPLFILETVGSGHNDILMIFFILLSYLFYLRKQPIFVAIALALAVNVKSTALLLVPLYAAAFFGQKLVLSIKFGIAFVLFYLALFSTMGIEPLALIRRTTFSTDLYWQSLPQQLVKVSPAVAKLLTPLFLIFYAIFCLRAFIRRHDPLVLYGKVYFLYLLIALGAYWNWYSLWVLTAFVFLGWGKLTRMAAVFTFTSTLAYPLYWLSLRFNFTHPLWPIMIYLVIAGGPVVAYFYAKAKTH